MPDTTNDQERRRRRKPRKNASKLRDGIMKRGTTWSYVIRVKDPETGLSKPRWVGGFATEEAAKTARDESRVKARRGEYIDRNRITVAEYLDDWTDSHAMEIKPRTLLDYRSCIRLYVTPRIGHLPIQAVRASTITKLYRDLLTSGGHTGRPLAVPTVTHLHAVLRKAFRDAVIVDELIGSNPVERAKRPRTQTAEPGTVWTVAQLRAFLTSAQPRRSPSPDRRRWSVGSGSTKPPRAAEPASSRSTTKPPPSFNSARTTRPPSSSTRATPGTASKTATSSRPAGANRSIPTASRR